MAERLQYSGVFGAVNAFAVDDDGLFAYLFDPRADTTIRIDIRTGNREVLVWYDRSFHHRRWLCYCMFAYSSIRSTSDDDASSTTYLPTLFYNTKRKQFILVTFFTEHGEPALYTLNEIAIDVEPIRLDRLAYNAHKDDNKIHMVFYERFTRHLSVGSDEDSTRPLSYVNCCYDCNNNSTVIHSGSLPKGQWELPFVAHSYLHFISTEHASTQLAAVPINEKSDDNVWDIRLVSSDFNGANPPRKAVWCNAWRSGMGWYVVAEKIDSDQERIKKITVWQLDVLDCQWRMIPLSIEAPSTARNFALRIEENNIAFLHIDWDDRDGVLFKLNLIELMSQRPPEASACVSVNNQYPKCDEGNSPTASLSNTPNASTEIICLVCLDTYSDPRTLSCGHSVCFKCAEQMRKIAKSNIIRCSVCRKSTIIPACGLPVNYSLKDAIETLVKARQLKLSGLRCSKCHKSCDDKTLWVCVECAAKDNSMDLSEGIISHIKRAKLYSLCAQCVLKYHTNHRVIEYFILRQCHTQAEKVNEQCKKDAAGLLQQLSANLFDLIEQCIISQLRNDVLNDLTMACDAISFSDNEIVCRSNNVISSFEQRAQAISSNAQQFFTNAIDNSSRSKDGPTKL